MTDFAKRHERIEAELALVLSPRQFQQEYDNYICASATQQAKIELIRDTVVFGNKWLFLYGGSGTGKGHIATVIFKERIRELRSAIMKNAFDLFREVKLNYLESEALIEKYKQVDCLIIDEIEKFGGSARETEKDVLFSILNYRYEYLKQTIIISNENYSATEALLTAPMLDRIAEMGGVIHFDWQSHRRQVICF